MNRNRNIIHVGLSDLFLPITVRSKSEIFQFQSNLEELGIEITGTNYASNQNVLTRQLSQSVLTIQILNAGPNITQLLVVSENPEVSLESIEEDFERVLEAFDKVWSIQGKNVVKSDLTVRLLTDSSTEHAFGEIWEKRLRQSRDGLQQLGRPILGGGLRFVLPPLNNQDPEDHGIEIKIESFFPDPRKVFMETIFLWSAPRIVPERWSVSDRIQKVIQYMEQHLIPFLDQT
ncbi:MULTISPECIES: hypothetical protein [Leptospira]|uniref:TIGR04255 family protein n=4 Tax=Leptospira kirschneri TaxID=29507 RepID=A0A1T1DYG2_9LEPT|nr:MULTISPECIES: hypothetical protein [Leptospira]EJO69685.1 hypothetical protein LEP1GSC044_3478 [Leptospira kirschneri serovar Grippotyphosa str. RM52]EKO15927.1 hypothetical protein LEP1GSC081_2440 [Leptospira kirschneri str. H1]EKO49870.1 hypothetical protein LEP1GSC131_3690 [Leptospira kirschneri str. 200802841]EKO62699.1 hypothetical protein LEP1GSC082_4633 [Leptospira kirschneri str. H2]EKP06061.1 hypothetical protein LEP1GSC018_1841 [Leptospira kirschneri str. 2008720114]